MKNYKVFINGQNFFMVIDDKTERMGFYATRYVSAENKKDAEIAAIEIIRKDKSIQHLKNHADDPPMLYVEEIEEIDPKEKLPKQIRGFTYYPDNEDTKH